MKVILLENIENLGKKMEIKDVPSGFARNFLIPKGLVIIATPENIKKIEEEKIKNQEKTAKELELMEKQASQLDGTEVIIEVTTGKEGQLFQSINKQKISEQLKELGFEIDKNHIDLKNPIKELGEFPVKIKFEHNLEVEIKVIVSEKIEN
ncbi:MAG: 50S ribosomal protein L9 [Candidatus Pacebacteria bacterium]|nr:50S ribosomal protein L9 [Candidatus Paceibacterota bacterium]MDD5753104.1 50S ribosomal protein L9 [Candidatus Paceibacterota bacterium]